MLNEQLLSYVAQERSRGVSDDAIKTELIAKGWNMEDIVSALGNTAPKNIGFSFTNLFKGRIGRMQYFVTSIILMLVVLFPGNLFVSFSFEFDGIILLIFLLMLFVVYVVSMTLEISITVRRLHDIGMSGWFTLILFVPFLNLLWVLYLLFRRGEGVPNKYGPVPERKNYTRVLLNI